MLEVLVVNWRTFSWESWVHLPMWSLKSVLIVWANAHSLDCWEGVSTRRKSWRRRSVYVEDSPFLDFCCSFKTWSHWMHHAQQQKISQTMTAEHIRMQLMSLLVHRHTWTVFMCFLLMGLLDSCWLEEQLAWWACHSVWNKLIHFDWLLSFYQPEGQL